MYLARVQDQLTVNLPKAGTWSCVMVEEAASIKPISKQFAHRGSFSLLCSRLATRKLVTLARLGNLEDTN